MFSVIIFFICILEKILYFLILLCISHIYKICFIFVFFAQRWCANGGVILKWSKLRFFFDFMGLNLSALVMEKFSYENRAFNDRFKWKSNSRSRLLSSAWINVTSQLSANKIYKRWRLGTFQHHISFIQLIGSHD